MKKTFFYNEIKTVQFWLLFLSVEIFSFKISFERKCVFTLKIEKVKKNICRYQSKLANKKNVEMEMRHSERSSIPNTSLTLAWEFLHD